MSVRIRFFKEHADGRNDTDYSILVPDDTSSLPPIPAVAFQHPDHFIKTTFHETKRLINSFLHRLADSRHFEAIALNDDYLALWIPEINSWVGIFFWRPDEQDIFFNWVHEDESTLKGPYRFSEEQIEIMLENIKKPNH